MQNIKKLFLGLILTALTIASFGASVSASAADGDAAMRVGIPFEFYVKNEKLAAGKYELRKISGRLYVLQNKETGRKQLVATTLGLANNKGLEAEKLVFNRYGSQTFLREIYSNRTADGQGWSESQAEKKARAGQESDDQFARSAERKTVSVTIVK